MTLFEAVRTSDDSGREIVVVTGELDLASAPRAKAVATSWGATPDGAPVLLDLAGVTFLDSTGLGALLEVRTAAQEAGRAVELVARSSAVDRVLSLAGLDTVFDTTAGGAV